MKKRNWVNLIDENSNNNTRKFVPLNEQNETIVVSDAKKHILFQTIIESFLKLNSKRLFSERTSSDILLKGAKIDANDDRMSHDFFQGEGRGEWREFEKHAEIISQFMGASD